MFVYFRISMRKSDEFRIRNPQNDATPAPKIDMSHVNVIQEPLETSSARSSLVKEGDQSASFQKEPEAAPDARETIAMHSLCICDHD
uniref:Uncharacterized protein n=1 Tax=Caenorhabditis tropicalis TaxID=1561998 RepID=A0A1I7V4T5_9PELO